MIIRADADYAQRIHSLESRAIQCAWTLEQIKAALGSSDYIFYAAVENGLFAGYISLRQITPDELEICNVAIDAGFRRRGIAYALLEHLSKTHAGKTVYLEVASRNTAAQGLYKKAGFAQIGLRKGYYNGDDALLFSTRL